MLRRDYKRCNLSSSFFSMVGVSLGAFFLFFRCCFSRAFRFFFLGGGGGKEKKPGGTVN